MVRHPFLRLSQCLELTDPSSFQADLPFIDDPKPVRKPPTVHRFTQDYVLFEADKENVALSMSPTPCNIIFRGINASLVAKTPEGSL